MGYTPLHLASILNEDVIINQLLNGQAIVDKTNQYGQTPLQLAAMLGHTTVVNLLRNKANLMPNEDLYFRTTTPSIKLERKKTINFHHELLRLI